MNFEAIYVVHTWIVKHPQLSLFDFGFNLNTESPSRKKSAGNEDPQNTSVGQSSLNPEPSEDSEEIREMTDVSDSTGACDPRPSGASSRASQSPTLCNVSPPYDIGLVYEFAHQLNSGDK